MSMCGCLSHAPYWGPGPEPKHVDWELNHWPFGLQAVIQSIEPHQPGLCRRVLRRKVFGHVILGPQQSFSHLWSLLTSKEHRMLVSHPGRTVMNQCSMSLIFLHRLAGSNKKLENNLKSVHWFSHAYLPKFAFSMCVWLLKGSVALAGVARLVGHRSADWKVTVWVLVWTLAWVGLVPCWVCTKGNQLMVLCHIEVSLTLFPSLTLSPSLSL